jgi:hypothetical protein
MAGWQPQTMNLPARFIESGAIPGTARYYAWVYPKGGLSDERRFVGIPQYSIAYLLLQMDGQ